MIVDPQPPRLPSLLPRFLAIILCLACLAPCSALRAAPPPQYLLVFHGHYTDVPIGRNLIERIVHIESEVRDRKLKEEFYAAVAAAPLVPVKRFLFRNTHEVWIIIDSLVTHPKTLFFPDFTDPPSFSKYEAEWTSEKVGYLGSTLKETGYLHLGHPGWKTGWKAEERVYRLLDAMRISAR